MMPHYRLMTLAATLALMLCAPAAAQVPAEFSAPVPSAETAVGPPVVYETTPPQNFGDIYAAEVSQEYSVDSTSPWLPVVDEPWDARRWSFGPFVGVAFGDEVVNDQVKFDDGLYTGVRIARAYDDRFTTEARLAYGRIGVFNLQGPPDERDAEIFIGGTSLVFTPRVGPRLRPFLSAGGGFAHLDFTDQNGTVFREFVPAFSPGAGLEYRVSDWLQLRLDVRDQILFGRATGLETMNHLTVAAALEYRFGPRPVFYDAL